MKFFKRKIPKVGSIYTIKEKYNAYNGMTGIVFHHLGGESFGINCGTNIVCNINP